MTGEVRPSSAAWLAFRSLLWAALLPGFFAGYVPWRYFGLGQVRLAALDPPQLLGLLGVALGATLLAVCIWEFARSGRTGTTPAEPSPLAVSSSWIT